MDLKKLIIPYSKEDVLFEEKQGDHLIPRREGIAT
jgi:hypothetical protein